MRRWLPATLATGALLSGAVPAGRRIIDKDVSYKADNRRALNRLVEAGDAG